MKLTILGCAGSFPSAESPASGYLVQARHGDKTVNIVVDLGNGSLGALQRYISPNEIDAILLSHLHPDHCMDMCGLFVARRYHPQGRCGRIPVWAPPGAGEFLARAYGGADGDQMREQFLFHQWDPSQPVDIAPVMVEVVPVVHPVPAFAIRLTANGRTLVYSGDTGPTPRLAELADGADVLLAEASFLESRENPPGLHLTGADAARAANQAQVDRLVLTHIPAWTDSAEVLREAQTVRSGHTELARPGAVHRI